MTVEASTDAPVFKVQILTSGSVLKKNSKLLKGRTDADYYREGGIYKYTVGASTNYQVIYQLRKEVLSKFPEAFIIAFKNGKKTDVNEAIREYKKRKGKK
jgi:N-acetylmuramoyl-L-alanine amidase